MARAPGAADAAESDFRRAIAIATEEAKSLELRATVSLARLLSAQGGRPEARAQLQGAYGRLTEGFQTRDMREAAALLAELA